MMSRRRPVPSSLPAGPLAILAAGLLAVSGAWADTSRGELTGGRSFVFSEEAALHEAPSETSAVICAPPVGTEVFGLAGVDIQHTSDGLSTPWMRGTCELGGERFQGYIPMSWLALTWQDLGADTLLLFGVPGRGPLYGHFTGVAKVVSRGRMLWGIVFTTPDIRMGGRQRWGSDVSSESPDPAGLSGVEDLVLLSFVGDAQGDESRDHHELLAWTGRYLVPGISAGRISDGGIVLLDQTILLPGEDRSFENVVRIVSTWEAWDEEAMEAIVENVDTTTWMWNGIEFIERGY